MTQRPFVGGAAGQYGPPSWPQFLSRLWNTRGPRRWMLVGPPAIAVVCGLVDLRLLLNGGVLAALSSAALWVERAVSI